MIHFNVLTLSIVLLLATQCRTAAVKPARLHVPAIQEIIQAAEHAHHSIALREDMVQLAFRVQTPEGLKGLYSPLQEQTIAERWSRFLLINNQLIRIYSENKHFHLLKDENEQLRSFSVFLLTGLAFYRNSLLVTRLFEKNKAARNKLNEASVPYGIEQGSYNILHAIAADSNNFKQTKSGLAYYFSHRNLILKNHAVSIMKDSGINYEEALKTLQFEIVALHKEMPGMARLTQPADSLLETARTPFYNIQSSISMFFGHTKSPLAEETFGNQAVSEIEVELMPGDVLITRSSGYVSNLFLPGFWKHAIFYAGKNADLAALYADPVLTKKANMFVRSGAEPGKNSGTTVEAVGQGVVVSDLATSLTSNYVVALRPVGLSSVQQRQAIRRAYQFLGTPYDFDFDFATTAKIVCTELIYQIYGFFGGRFQFPISQIAGRRVVPPNTFVQKGLPPEKSGLSPQSFEVILIARSSKGGLKWIYRKNDSMTAAKASQSVKDLYITDL